MHCDILSAFGPGEAKEVSVVHTYPAILSGILSSIHSGMLSGIHFGILAGKKSDILSGIYRIICFSIWHVL